MRGSAQKDTLSRTRDGRRVYSHMDVQCTVYLSRKKFLFYATISSTYMRRLGDRLASNYSSKHDLFENISKLTCVSVRLKQLLPEQHVSAGFLRVTLRLLVKKTAAAQALCQTYARDSSVYCSASARRTTSCHVPERVTPSEESRFWPQHRLPCCSC
jgi:hypothetical protein